MTKQLSQKEMQKRLWKAAREGDCQTIRMLVVAGADINAQDPDGFTAFNIATRHGRKDAAVVLLAAREMAFAEKLGVEPEEFYKLKQDRKKKKQGNKEKRRRWFQKAS